MTEKHLILLSKCLMTECLLDELPVVIDLLVLILELWVCILLVLVHELLEGICIEAACLLVHEWRLEKKLICSLIEDIANLIVGNCETELLCVVLNELSLNVGVPYLIANLIELVLSKVFLALCQLDDIAELVNQLLEFIISDLVAENRANLLAGTVPRSLA